MASWNDTKKKLLDEINGTAAASKPAASSSVNAATWKATRQKLISAFDLPDPAKIDASPKTEAEKLGESFLRENSSRDARVRNNYAAKHDSAETKLNRSAKSLDVQMGLLDTFKKPGNEPTTDRAKATYNKVAQKTADDFNKFDRKLTDYKTEQRDRNVRKNYETDHPEEKLAQLNKAKANLSALKKATLTGDTSVSGMDIAEARKEVKSLENQYEEVARRYSEKKSTKQNAALNADFKATGEYNKAQVIERDMDRIAKVAAYVSTSAGDAAEAEEYTAYLKDTYGLTDEALKNYAIGGKNGAGDNLWRLYEKLEGELAGVSGELGNKGFDYDRIVQYRETLKEKAVAEAKTKESIKYAKEHPILASIDSVLVAPVRGLESIRKGLELAGNGSNTDYENYVPVDSYDMDVTNYVGLVRDVISKDIEKNCNWELFGTNLGSFMYQTGLSIADSAFNMAAFGSASIYAMGLNAAADRQKEILDNGGTTGQAFWGGLASGFCEAFFERFSVEALLKPTSVGSLKELLKSTAKQMGTEASEEIFTEIANIIFDNAIMGDKSDYQALIERYEASGLSAEDAKKQATLDMVAQVGWAGAGGAISGGFMGGTMAGFNYTVQSQELNKAFNTMTDFEKTVMLSTALELAEESSETQTKLAEAMDRLNKGHLTARQFVKVLNDAQMDQQKLKGAQSSNPVEAEYNKAAIQNPESTVLDPTASQLAQTGMKADTAQTQADLLNKVFNGEATNNSIKKLDLLDKSVQQALVEHNPEVEISDADSRNATAMRKIFKAANERNAQVRQQQTALSEATDTLVAAQTQQAPATPVAQVLTEMPGATVEQAQQVVAQQQQQQGAEPTISFEDGSTATRSQIIGSILADTPGATQADAEMEFEAMSQYNNTYGRPFPGSANDYALQNGANNGTVVADNATTNKEGKQNGKRTKQSDESGRSGVSRQDESGVQAARRDDGVGNNSGRSDISAEGSRDASPNGQGRAVADAGREGSEYGRNKADDRGGALKAGDEVSINDLLGTSFEGLDTKHLILCKKNHNTNTRKIAKDARRRGRTVYFVQGSIQAPGMLANGLHFGKTIVVQLDDTTMTPEQIYIHELGHDTIDEERAANNGYSPTFSVIKESMLLDPETLNRILDQYKGIYLAAAQQQTALSVIDYIIDEIIGDALGHTDTNGAAVYSDLVISAFAKTLSNGTAIIENGSVRLSAAGYVREDGEAKWTPERIDRLYDDYASSQQNYSKAYATYISPDDFLSLTTSHPERIEAESHPLDVKELQGQTQMIHLSYDPENPGEVWGHEGRHRMVALRNAGVDKVAITVEFIGEQGKQNRQPIAELPLVGEEFRSGRAPGNVTLTDLVPISRAYRSEIESKFGANEETMVRFSAERSKDTDGRELTPAQQEFFKDSQARDEQGQLVALYHGSPTAGFTVFEKTEDLGYFFTNREDNAMSYSGTYDEFKPLDFKTWDDAIAYAEENDYTLERNEDGDYVFSDGWSSPDVYTESELKAFTDEMSAARGEDSGNYNVYLNLKDPLIINGDGQNWDSICDSYEGCKTYDELTDEEKQDIADNMGMDVDELPALEDYSGEQKRAYDVDSLCINWPQSTREWVAEAKEMGYDGVIFRNITDTGSKFSYSIESDVYVTLDSNQIKSVYNENPTSADDIRYSRKVTDKKTLDWLNGQETIKVYRAMQLIDGKLYPPMAAKVKPEEGGRKKLQNTSDFGAWEQTEERPDLAVQGKNGDWYFVLDKANGKSLSARYNPYIHTSRSMLNDQFTSAYDRENLVTVEGEIPVSELTSGYKAEKAKDPVGEVKWRNGPVSSKLKGEKTRRVILSRWFKPIRVIPNSEVAESVATLLDGENIAIPYKVVTPGLREELEKLGVPIKYPKGKTPSERFNTATPDIRYSVSERDKKYLAAVESGDMKTAQKMVDEAARVAMPDTQILDEYGNLQRVYHGSEEIFNVFDRTKTRANMDIQGSFFSPWEDDAGGYGTNVRGFYLNIKNPADESTGYKALNKFKGQNEAGVKARDILVNMGYDGVNNGNEEYIAFYPEQIKSADPATYDDDGDLIPLSERFNIATPDIRYSIKSNFAAVGVVASRDENNVITYTYKGKPVTEITDQMIRESVLGKMTKSHQQVVIRRGATAKQAKAEYDKSMTFYKDLLNTIIKMNDPQALYDFAGSTVFSALKANADKQYGTTIDFSTICLKTEQMVNLMSAAMVKKKGGLTISEINALYNAAVEADEPVPCPMCYVFSRWIGLGGLLDNIYSFQNKYSEMSQKALRAEVERIEGIVAEAQQRREATGKTAKKPGKTRADLVKNLKAQQDKLVQKVNAEYETVRQSEADLKTASTVEGRVRAQQRIDEARAKISDLEDNQLAKVNEELKTFSAYGWLTGVRLTDHYTPVPAEVLFDLNRGAEFASTPEWADSWKFRNSSNNIYGKSIEPYADARLGEITQGLAKGPGSIVRGMYEGPMGNQTGASNPFNTNVGNGLSDKQAALMQTAKDRVRQQNLRGGQRLQSTSDFIFSHALDYILAFYELESLDSMAQVYTKVPEDVPLFATAKAAVNMSLMPLGMGLDEDGNLVFSSRTGMDADTAFALMKRYDTATPILVTVSDEHTRAAMADPRILFIIPYHKSGGRTEVIVEMLKSLGEELGKYTDYTKYQNETWEKSKTYPARELRNKILLAEEQFQPSAAEAKLMASLPLLQRLYDNKFVNTASELYGVAMLSEDTKHIYPYEYWDFTSTLETADVNGQRYLDWCEAIGCQAKFAGNSKGEHDFRRDTGYWKALVDRRMYDNNGNYLPQRPVTTSGFTEDLIDAQRILQQVLGGDYNPAAATQLADSGKTEEILNAALRFSASTEARYPKGSPEATILEVLNSEGTMEEKLQKLNDWAAELRNAAPANEETATSSVNDIMSRVFQPKLTAEEQAASEETISDLLNEYGALPTGEKAARDIHYPAQTNDENRVRKFVQTAAEAESTPDRIVPKLTQMVVRDEAATYEPISDKKALNYAEKQMQRKGYQTLLREWDGLASSEHFAAKNDVAIGELLAIEAAKVGDDDTALRIFADVAAMGTQAGQTVQAMSLLKKMTPSGQLYYLTKAVDRMNHDLAKRIGKGSAKEIKLNPKLAKAVLRSQTQEELDAAMEAVLQDIADQMPVTFRDKWDAWRYLSMLGNPRTHIRNILGNSLFMPITYLKDLMAAGLEGVFLEDGERTKDVKQLAASAGRLIPIIGKGAETEYTLFAADDYYSVRDELVRTGKYNPADLIRDKRKIFKTKLFDGVNHLTNFNGMALEAEDGWALKPAYVRALSQYLAANHADLEHIADTKENKRLLNKARAYAMNEAQKATYRDFSAVANALNRLKKVPGLGIFIDGVLPFTKTPINILKRGLEYSPIGLLTDLSYGIYKTKVGDWTASEFIDHISAGMTGTMVAVLGFFLKGLCGGDDEDKKQAEFDKLQGYQNYSFTIGGVNFTIDWMAPMALPLFVGMEVRRQFADGGLTAGELLDTALLIAEPLFSLSMLDGLNQTFKNSARDQNPAAAIFTNAVLGYFGQAVPTLFGQLARTIDGDRRSTYVDKNSAWPDFAQRFWQSSVLAKTPGLSSERAAYIDAWGRKDTTNNALLRGLENFLSPSYVNAVKVTPVDEELQRLSDAIGDTDILPKLPEKYFSVNKVRKDLTADEYETYAVVRGKTAYNLMADLILSESYSYMTDAEKALAVTDIYDYATQVAKQEVAPDFEPDSWVTAAQKSSASVSDLVALRTIGKSYPENSTLESAADMDWLSDDERGNVLKATYYSDTTFTDPTRKGYEYNIKGTEWQNREAEIYAEEFDERYAKLVDRTSYQNADAEKQTEDISKLQADAREATRKKLAREMKEAGEKSAKKD